MDADLGCIVGLFRIRPVYLNNEDPWMAVVDENLCANSHTCYCSEQLSDAFCLCSPPSANIFFFFLSG